MPPPRRCRPLPAGEPHPPPPATRRTAPTAHAPPPAEVSLHLDALQCSRSGSAGNSSRKNSVSDHSADNTLLAVLHFRRACFAANNWPLRMQCTCHGEQSDHRPVPGRLGCIAVIVWRTTHEQPVTTPKIRFSTISSEFCGADHVLTDLTNAFSS